MVNTKRKGSRKKKAESNKEEEPPTELDEIDEELRKQAVDNLEKEQDKSIFELPGRIISSVGEAAKSALSTDDENMGAAASGKPFDLPSEEEVFEEVGKGLKNAVNTMTPNKGKNDEKGFFGEMASNMTNNIVDGVKKIGKGALGTIDNASKMTNNALKAATYKKCNPEFMENIGGIIDTCDRDNYVEIYNIIVEKLKLKKNFFKEHLQTDINNLKPLNLFEKPEVLTEEDNTLGVESELDVAEKIVEADIETPLEIKKTKKKGKKKKQGSIKKGKATKGTVKKGKPTKFLKGKKLITGIQV